MTASRIPIAALLVLFVTAACSNGVPLGPSDAGTAAGGAAPTPSAAPATTAAVAYTPDLQPIFASDCVPCHGGRQVAARYSTTTYAGVMAAVRSGSASSPLVIVTQPGGVMYAFLSGDRAWKAAMIRTWVLNGAPQSR